jgi:flagellar motor switch protein FliM
MRSESYDFRKPSRLSGDLEERLVAWFAASFALAAEKWAKHLETPVTHGLASIDTVRPSDALAELSDAVVAYHVVIGVEDLRTLVAIPRQLMLTLAAGVLGESCTELCPDRNPTAVEMSLVEFLLQQLLGAIQESWPEGEPLTVTLKDSEPVPKRTRMFKPDENIVRFSLLMRGPFGEQPWHWLAPQKGLSNLFGRTAAGSTVEQESGVRARLESFVGAMPLEVAVRLGGAELRVSELASLRSGDLVLLDQPISSPLPASVAGETRFLVWPGRVGAKQAIRIESLVES